MREWYSKRFRCMVHLSNHAIKRMIERSIDSLTILELIETGKIRHKDKTRMWIYKVIENRDDNLICAAVVLEDKIIIKTVMHRWQIVEEVYEDRL